MAEYRFTKKVIGSLENGDSMNTFSALGDVNGDGKIDAVLSGRDGKMVWFENNGDQVPWEKHEVADVEQVECGGQVVDLTGNGLGDIVCGGDYRNTNMWWWENPGEKGGPWTKRVIATTDQVQFHDAIVADLFNDGKKYLLFTNQQRGTVVRYVPVPEDPRVSPWPDLKEIAAGKKVDFKHDETGNDLWRPEEGIVVADVDGDGQNEVVCGTHWYKYEDGKWVEYEFAEDYITTKIVVADVDGDGKNEIVLAEGDACIYGRTKGGKLGVFKPGKDITQLWDETEIARGLLDPHSLAVADFHGNGRMDIMIGEIGFRDMKANEWKVRPPKVSVFENKGDGTFQEHIIDQGPGIHDAGLVDLRGNGKLDFVGKPLHDSEKWNMLAYINEM